MVIANVEMAAAWAAPRESTGPPTPIRFGNDADDAFSFVSTLGITRGLTQDLDDAGRAAALEALHATLIEHETDGGVLFGGSAW
jgi:hypothetical protein